VAIKLKRMKLKILKSILKFNDQAINRGMWLIIFCLATQRGKKIKSWEEKCP